MFKKHPRLRQVLSVIASVLFLALGILSLVWSAVFFLGHPGGNHGSIVWGTGFLAFGFAVMTIGAWLLRVGWKTNRTLKQTQQSFHPFAVRAWVRGTAAILLLGVLSLIAWQVLRLRGKAIGDYVHFLEKQQQTPVDYILDLFDRYDMVVLCERAHPEVTQYEMIYELVSDQRFQQQGGHVFTELGTAVLQPFVESFLMDDQLTDEQVNEKLRYIARNFCGYPVWDKTNIYDFLRKLYYLNRSIPKDRRVHVYPTDIEFRWVNATRESRAEYDKRLSQRDKVEADYIITKFNQIRQSASQNKALVIMNYRHAFPHLMKNRSARVANTAGFLMEAYAGRVANVMLNSVGLLPGSTDSRGVITALQQGKWDAAFAMAGNPNVGFDFRGSRFGQERFDFFPFIRTRLQYQDVFTGFVFFKPLEAHRMSFGLPGLIDQSFADELYRRYRLVGANRTREEVAREIDRLAAVRISTYENDTNVISRSDCAKKIRQWLKAKP